MVCMICELPLLYCVVGGMNYVLVVLTVSSWGAHSDISLCFLERQLSHIGSFSIEDHRETKKFFSAIMLMQKNDRFHNMVVTILESAMLL